MFGTRVITVSQPPISSQQLTADDIASPVSLTVPAGAKSAMVTVQDDGAGGASLTNQLQAVKYRIDGEVSADNYHVLGLTDTIFLYGSDQLENFSAAEFQSGVACTIFVTYFSE